MSDASARLTRISAALKQAGDRDNLNALRRGLRAGAAPIVPALQNAARERLPKKGGLNERVARRRITVNTRLAGRSASVLIRSTKAGSNRQTNAGFVRHPVFPRGAGILRRTWDWVQEEIPAAEGWWDQTAEEKAPDVRHFLEASLDEVSLRINRL